MTRAQHGKRTGEASRSTGDYMIMGKVASYSGAGDRLATCASGAGCTSTDITAGGNPILEGDPASAVTVRVNFICSGPDGVGVQLVHLNEQDRRDFHKFLAAARPRRQA